MNKPCFKTILKNPHHGVYLQTNKVDTKKVVSLEIIHFCVSRYLLVFEKSLRIIDWYTNW